MAGLDRAFTAGVARAVLGTAAIEDPALVDAALLAFGPERVAIGIDVRAGKVRVRGWVDASALDAITLGHDMRARGVRWCIFTDTDRDGISAGVNLVDTLALARNTGLQVIASGGVASLSDVEAVANAGLPGVIIGRALYEGAFTLADALAAGRGPKKGSA
jgi:phosphoribosylformimino-5-aminoimidazole carboxamide ribotide isomerase